MKSLNRGKGRKIVKRLFQAQLFVIFLSNVSWASEEKIDEAYRFVGNERAMQICAAALNSDISIVSEAKRLHLTRKSLKDVTCRGQSLTDFAETSKFSIGPKAIASAK